MGCCTGKPVEEGDVEPQLEKDQIKFISPQQYFSSAESDGSKTIERMKQTVGGDSMDEAGYYSKNPSKIGSLGKSSESIDKDKKNRFLFSGDEEEDFDDYLNYYENDEGVYENKDSDRLRSKKKKRNYWDGQDELLLPDKQYCLFDSNKYYDEGNKIWFRTVYLFDNLFTHKLFLSLYNINLDLMNKDDFDAFCDGNGFECTKNQYKILKTFTGFPYTKVLQGLRNKYEVNFYISDSFVFSGRGPYRALCCYGRGEYTIDRALNEYERRSLKNQVIPHLVKNWDNFSFPDPKFPLHCNTFPPTFPWPSRFRSVQSCIIDIPPNKKKFPIELQKEQEEIDEEEDDEGDKEEEKTKKLSKEVDNDENKSNTIESVETETIQQSSNGKKLRAKKKKRSDQNYNVRLTESKVKGFFESPT